MANKSGIHINPKHVGEFTAKAKKIGMTVQQFETAVLRNPTKYSKQTVKQANFSRNARGFKK